MNAPAVVWIVLNLWFNSAQIPVRLPSSSAAAYEARMLRLEAEELRNLAERYVERRRSAAVQIPD